LYRGDLSIKELRFRKQEDGKEEKAVRHFLSDPCCQFRSQGLEGLRVAINKE
jgi:hypothetical protein